MVSCAAEGPLSILMTQKEQFAPVPAHVLEAPGCKMLGFSILTELFQGGRQELSQQQILPFSFTMGTVNTNTHTKTSIPRVPRHSAKHRAPYQSP